MHLEEPEEPGEEETEEPVTIDDAVSTMSDLYASVQTQRAKIVDSADGEEGYANHLWDDLLTLRGEWRMF